VSDCALIFAQRDVLKAVGRQSLHYDGRTWSYEPPVCPGNRRRDSDDLVP
jgi:hypothetical protein